MKIAFLVNNIQTEQAVYTTIRLAMAANNRGHESWIIGIGELLYANDETIWAHAYCAPRKKYKSTKIYLETLQKSSKETVKLDDFDVMLLRNDPCQYPRQSWAENIGITFGRIAASKGVITLNDPNGLALAHNKIYLQYFPAELRPKAIITQNPSDIRKFMKEQKKSIILKPLHGSGGKNVFLLRHRDLQNLNQIIETMSTNGYIIAQEYLKEAERGDIRLFVIDGVPLKHKGKYAAFQRVRLNKDDIRNNVSTGATIKQTAVTDEMLRIVEILRPKLLDDGMFLVGLDIVGNKVMEINVFSPGGLGSAQKLEGVNFSHAVIKILERKVLAKSYYGEDIDTTKL